jgi:integrase
MTAEEIRARRASANRVLTILKAGLNQAFRDDQCASDRAWKAVEPFNDVNKPRIRFFDRDEIRRLLNAAQGDFRTLCRAALYTGCRYGELMRLRVGEFEADSGTVYIAESKSGKPRRVMLAPEGRRFFEGLVAGRQRDAFMLIHADGEPWRDTQQSAPMALAMKAARVERASFHCWRKTAASHWLMSGVHLSVVSSNFGHADSRLTESTYSHLAPSFRSDEMRKAPDFGGEPSTIVPMK